jgi:hypothetical protein
MIYTECVSPYPRTCQHPLSSTHTTQNTECTPGCVCSNETVYDSLRNECVQLEQCKCQYNNIVYQPNDQVTIDCNDW